MLRLYAQSAHDWKRLAWVRLLGMTAWVVIVLFGVAMPGMAQEKGQIEGVVRLGDKEIADHRIMLIRFGPGPQDVNRTPGQTDAEGRFRFDGLETGSNLSYVVGIRYDSQLFRSPSVVLEAGQTRTDLVLEVGDKGTRATGGPAPSGPPVSAGPQGPEGVHIGQRIVAVAFRDNHLEVREILGIRHSGDKPYEGPGGKGKSPYVLHFPLPEGHYNVRGLEGLDQSQVRSDPSGLVYVAPLPPGVHRVMYTYALPIPESLTTLMFRHTLPTLVFDMFVEAEHLVATSEVRFLGRVPIESHVFLHFRGVDLAPSSRTWLQVTRLTAGANWLALVSSYSIIIGLMCLGILIPLYGVWKRRTPPERELALTSEQLQQWRRERARLVQLLARLDDERETGVLSEREHRQQRQVAKQELLDVATQLRLAELGEGPREPALAIPKDSA